MNFPVDLSENSCRLLDKLGFKLEEAYDKGMWKGWLWKNCEMGLSLSYDRGYYECEVIPLKKPGQGMVLIRLLRFLKDDQTFYRKEIIKSNLYNCLPADEYMNVFFRNYELISAFMETLDEDRLKAYEAFDFGPWGL